MRSRILAAFGLAGVLVVGALVWGVRAEGGDVEVQQAYFVAASPAGDDLNLTANLFVTNGALLASDRVAVTVFVVPHSGLSTYTTRVDVGKIDARSTEQATIPIVIPQFNASRSYRVDFLVFEDDLLTQRGSGSVGWGGGIWYEAGKLADEALSISAPSFQRVG